MMKALILSAGLGTRLRPYSNLTPKPLFTLADRPLLDLHIRQLAQMGCEAAAVNTHHLNEAIEKFIRQQTYPIPVHMRHETRLLGTGGAIDNLTDFWGNEPFVVINADIFHEFDLAAIYDYHCRHSDPVTLVLYDDPAFNSVTVDRQNCVRRFQKSSPEAPPPHSRMRTFTGIQVLDPLVLDFMPSGQPSHSIDAYAAMMKAGYTIKAYEPDDGYWTDLGTPERYRDLARKMTAQSGFKAAFGDDRPGEIVFEPLAGDGSERRWFRLQSDRHSLIMCDHGLREHNATAEVDAFVAIGNHLNEKQLPVPQIYFHDRFAGLVILEDLGNLHLQTAVRLTSDAEQIGRWYRRIIADLITLSMEGIRGFQPAWAYQSENYDRALILEKECRYFIEAFVNGHLNLAVDFKQLLPEFEHLAARAVEHAQIGFMHRDMQSRNIMVAGDQFYFIDFQAGRRGPLQYDLASLLIDPYVGLPEKLQAELLHYASELAAQRYRIDPDNFRLSYRYCGLSRNLQILGAFGFLYRVKGKDQFKAYIKPAAMSLHRQLTQLPISEFKALRALVCDRILPLI